MAKIYQFPTQQHEINEAGYRSFIDDELEEEDDEWDEELQKEWLAYEPTEAELAELEKEKEEFEHPWWQDCFDKSDLREMGALVDNGCAYDSDDDM